MPIVPRLSDCILFAEEVIAQVKIELVKLGYSCSDFLTNVDNSQEILLACGWLISTQNVFEIFISQLNLQVNNEYLKEDNNVNFLYFV